MVSRFSNNFAILQCDWTFNALEDFSFYQSLITMDRKSVLFVVFFTILLKDSLSFSCFTDKVKSLKIQTKDELCDRQMKMFVEAFRRDEKWAVDSMGTTFVNKLLWIIIKKLLISVFASYANFDKVHFYGNSFDFGDFDRCLEVEHKNGSESLKGKHCLVQYESTRSDIHAILPSKFKIKFYFGS